VNKYSTRARSLSNAGAWHRSRVRGIKRATDPATGSVPPSLPIDPNPYALDAGNRLGSDPPPAPRPPPLARLIDSLWPSPNTRHNTP